MSNHEKTSDKNRTLSSICSYIDHNVEEIDVLKDIVARYNLSEEEFVYIGDDVNDLACLEFAKYKITLPHAPKKLKSLEGIQITEKDCGCGAFREVVECLTI